jgi:2,4-dienoyl-CoA reductase-like NADH-dependent reductase (Old Yellow Enzyme family)
VTVTATKSVLLSPGTIGAVEVRNRVIRSSTSETLADDAGFVTDAYREFHARLARGGVGLIFTGHCYVHPRGRYIRGMTGMDRDELIPRLRTVTDAVHGHGARIFAQLNHAGSQSRDPDVDPVAPSVVANPQFFRTPPKAATQEEIEATITAFGEAAMRVRNAGFDGVHVHAGHGYLLSEFLSPKTNLRDDEWGGPLVNRQRFLLRCIEAMRAAVGADFPITVKLGFQDFVSGGLTLAEGRATAEALAVAGVDAIEVSAGLMSPAAESARRYAGVTRRRAVQDKLFYRVLGPFVPEAYFREEAKRLKERVDCAVILVGGLRTIELMEDVIATGGADFVSLARPLIREPELVREIEAGRRGTVDCVSCNICLMHEGTHALRCWRTSNGALLAHAWHRLSGKLQ